MAKKHDEERQPYVLAQDVNVGGQDCKKGGTLQLTSDEAEAMKAAGVKFEGDEEEKPEEAQSKHEEGVKELNKELEKRKKAAAEQEARDKAYEASEEFDEAAWSAEYDRQQKLVNEDYEAPVKEEQATDKPRPRNPTPAAQA